MMLEQGSSHDLHMIAANAMPSVLPHEVRILNGISRLCYRIEGCQPLAVVYEQELMPVETVRQIYEELCACIDGLREYLLPCDCLVLQPEHIYWQWDRQCVMFVLDPSHPQDIAVQLVSLTEYLMQHMDYGDGRESAWIYRLYDRIRRQGVSCELIADMCREGMAASPHPVGLPQTEKKYTEEDLQAMQEMYTMTEHTWLRKLTDWIGAWKQRLLKPEFLPVQPAGEADMPDLSGNRQSDKAQQISVEDVSRQSDSRGVHAMPNVGAMQAVNVMPNVDAKQAAAASVMQAATAMWNAGMVQDVDAVQYTGETTLLAVWHSGSPVLKALTPGYFDIMLAEGSHMLGRQEAGCRYVVPAASVSRMHARLAYRDGQVLATDMHSRNGTYINERRLELQTEQILQDGDQIRFGSVRFQLEAQGLPQHTEES